MISNLLVQDSEEIVEQQHFTIGDFSGPLDLLIYLIEKNEIDLFEIPIASLTSQYLSFLENIETLDMDFASDFLVMGASLLEMKSRMILPRDEKDAVEDPRDELVLKLLQYRRCKLLASELQKREEQYGQVFFRAPENPEIFGVEQKDKRLFFADESEFRSIQFDKARRKLQSRNQARFQDISEKMDYIVSREQLNLKVWIKDLWAKLRNSISLSFNKLFPMERGAKERLTGFLAVLELIKQNSVTAIQEGPFSDIVIRRRDKDNER